MGSEAIKSNTGKSSQPAGSITRPIATHQSSGVKSILSSGKSKRIQPKLRISTPGDVFEREADRVAEQVMRMPDPRLSASDGDSSPANGTVSQGGTIQRVCASCSEDEELIQAKTAGGQAPEVTSTISAGIQSLQGGGQPLPGPTRSFFEPRIGADFSKVRVHNDTRAASVARSINARAFTLGHNVVFGTGEYAPGTSSGRKLFAHELTHVVQQNEGARPSAELSAAAPAIHTVMREEEAESSRQFTGCTQDQIDTIEPARRAAAIRCQKAGFLTKGIVPPGPHGRPDSGEAARRRARRSARTIFGKNLNMEHVGAIVSEMGARLASPSLSFTCASDTDKNCGSRAAYVIGNRAPVYLCSPFFKSHSNEQRIRTLIHEAAHLSGISQARGELYCPIIDCESACGGFDVADAWLHYVHCVTGQKPDEPEK